MVGGDHEPDFARGCRYLQERKVMRWPMRLDWRREREREMAGWLAVEEASIRGLHSFVSSVSVSCPSLSDGYTLPFSLLCLLSVCLSGSLAFSFIHTTHIHPLQSSLAHAPWVLPYHYCHTALTSSSTSIIITGRTKAGGLDLSLRPESFSRAAYPACTALAPC